MIHVVRVPAQHDQHKHLPARLPAVRLLVVRRLVAVSGGMNQSEADHEEVNNRLDQNKYCEVTCTSQYDIMISTYQLTQLISLFIFLVEVLQVLGTEPTLQHPQGKVRYFIEAML